MNCVISVPSRLYDAARALVAFTVTVERDVITLLRMDIGALIYVPDSAQSLPKNINLLLASSLPAHMGDIVCVKPSYFAANAYQGNILDVYTRAGYKVSSVQAKDPFIPLTTDSMVISHLANVFSTAGMDTSPLERSSLLFHKAFISGGNTDIRSYEVLEAYGDGILGGAFVAWLTTLPGITEPAQLGVLKSRFLGREILADIAENLGLVQFIKRSYNTSLDIKVRSDIIESLMCAIYISYDDPWTAVMKFTNYIYSPYNINTVDAIREYKSPSDTFNEIAQNSLNREKIVKKVREGSGEFIFTILYDGRVLGEGRSSLANMVTVSGKVSRNVDQAKANAKTIAYSNAIQTLKDQLNEQQRNISSE